MLKGELRSRPKSGASGGEIGLARVRDEDVIEAAGENLGENTTPYSYSSTKLATKMRVLSACNKTGGIDLPAPTS